MRTLFRLIRNLFLLIFILAFIILLFIFGLVMYGTNSFPVEHGNLIEQYAQEYGVDPSLIAGIIKTESNFREDVVADDGGMGLMQLMPDTAKWSCEKLGLKYDPEALLDAEENIKVGTYYISYLIGRFQNTDLAVVAYNGGLKNVDQWLKDGTITWDRKTMKNIPFPITRKYIEKVTKAKKIYEVFYGEDLPDQTENLFMDSLDNFIDLFRYVKAQI